ncbi:MAG: STAS domain-containing protein, partial [Candidatus Hydrogenedentes bacterium]|nr:STAS domain-containing protein [Candidatus Hydrogenedentota bacterium]
ETGPVTVLRLDGDMDEAGVESLRTALYECATQGRFRVVLNLRDVGFMSYMSVGVLVERLRKFRGFGGDIKLVGLNLYTERLFRMVGITGLFERFDNEAQAAGTFQEAA